MNEAEVIDQLCLIAAAVIEDVHEAAVLHGNGSDQSTRILRLAAAGIAISALMRAATILQVQDRT